MLEVRLWKPFQRGDLIALFTGALILRLLFFSISANQAGMQKILDGCFDCNLYYKMAGAILSGTTQNVENGFLYFGPGYAYFVTAIMSIFGNRIVPVVIMNILLSSLNCLLIYLLAKRLLNSYAVALVAGVLAAVSYTAITISCMVMSDTLYFTIFLLTLLAFQRALTHGKWLHFILSGILSGAALLTRSIGLFWPLVMAAIALAWYCLRPVDRNIYRFGLGEYFRKVGTAVVIAMTIATLWMTRNKQVEGIFTMGITSANGPAIPGDLRIEWIEGVETADGLWAREIDSEYDPHSPRPKCFGDAIDV